MTDTATASPATENVIACSILIENDHYYPGTMAYVVNANVPRRCRRVEVIAQTRTRHWVRRWERRAHLGEFRVAAVGAGHPRYGEVATGAFPDVFRARVVMAALEAFAE